MLGILAPQFQSVEAARKHLEKTLWPEGPICPHCGIINEAYLMKGESTRDGLYKCSACRQPFTVTIGTIFEDSKIPLHKWLLAIHLMCSSKKGISSNQLKRELGISYQSAWFLTHRVRLAMTVDPLKSLLGTGPDAIVEVDETLVGGKPSNNK